MLTRQQQYGNYCCLVVFQEDVHVLYITSPLRVNGRRALFLHLMHPMAAIEYS